MIRIDLIIVIIIFIWVLWRVRIGFISSFTGGKLDEYINRWEIYAPQSYEKIRKSDDVLTIAKNTGFSENKIKRIKEHIFFQQHQLDDSIRIFDPDPDIADAWLRLQTGDYKNEDIKLLEHEYFESRFEGIFKTDYRTAHNATLKSGRTWTPE